MGKDRARRDRGSGVRVMERVRILSIFYMRICLGTLFNTLLMSVASSTVLGVGVGVK